MVRKWKWSLLTYNPCITLFCKVLTMAHIDVICVFRNRNLHKDSLHKDTHQRDPQFIETAKSGP